MYKFTIARSEQDFLQAKDLFLAYADWLGIELNYQNFERELEELPLQYGPPEGCLILLYSEKEAIGCVGVRRNEAQIAELKRMYILETYQGKGLGRQLLERAIEEARQLGYTSIRLDTFPTMKGANYLYESFGFIDIPAYRYNPFPETRFMELDIS